MYQTTPSGAVAPNSASRISPQFLPLEKLSSAGLAEALAELPRLAGRRVLIVVDQFEELFRYAGSDDDKVAGAQWREKAASFVQLLLQLHRRQSTAHVMITMRSDFIGDCAQFPKLPEAVSDVLAAAVVGHGRDWHLRLFDWDSSL